MDAVIEQEIVDSNRNNSKALAGDGPLNDEELVSEVQGHPIVWHPGRNDYRNKVKRDAAWKDIALTLQSTVGQCAGRWKYLRERYSRELKKNKTGSGRTPHWQLYHHISFLQPFVKPRNYSKVNINNEETEGLVQENDMCLETQEPRPICRITRSTGAFGSSTDLIKSPVQVHADNTSHNGSCEAPSPHSINECMDITIEPFSFKNNQTSPSTSSESSHCGRREASGNSDAGCEKMHDEWRGMLKTMELVATAVKEHSARDKDRPRSRPRIDILCDLLADRYMALNSDLQDEFDIWALQKLKELKKQTIDQN